MLSVPARYSLSQNGDRLLVVAEGRWTVETASSVNDALAADFQKSTYVTVDYDLSAVEELDTAGAYILTRALRMEIMCDMRDWQLHGATPGQTVLMKVAADSQPCTPPPQTRQFRDTLIRVGQATSRFWDELYATISFLGEFFAVFARVLMQPRRLRIKSTVALMEEVGLDAAPIVAVLSFAIGAVIAYMGANLLGALGFSVFMVDLVGFAMLRELAVVITAILIAGRSASAFTAQIGAMKMRQEIDAMTVMGLDTLETLVVPRAIACLLTIPILTFLAMMSGILGGLVVAWVTPTQISPLLFLSRLQEMVGLQHFWVGMVKAPFFAIVIAIIGCRQGLAVKGSVESLGSRVTTSVVQAIFAVILIDALFAILFFQIGV
ncbi:MlaE family ABC transporter permease [Algimonas porphyrae]|uniref:MlaE family ABC transporter permease n=1 Tax=Algimonas porphyrae TaxID=1128113 RepID=UPI0024E0E02A|nr:ABC transporter permease [Algimonas porphyrae]